MSSVARDPASLLVRHLEKHLEKVPARTRERTPVKEAERLLAKDPVLEITREAVLERRLMSAKAWRTVPTHQEVVPPTTSSAHQTSPDSLAAQLHSSMMLPIKSVSGRLLSRSARMTSRSLKEDLERHLEKDPVNRLEKKGLVRTQETDPEKEAVNSSQHVTERPMESIQMEFASLTSLPAPVELLVSWHAQRLLSSTQPFLSVIGHVTSPSVPVSQHQNQFVRMMDTSRLDNAHHPSPLAPTDAPLSCSAQLDSSSPRPINGATTMISFPSAKTTLERNLARLPVKDPVSNREKDQDQEKPLVKDQDQERSRQNVLDWRTDFMQSDARHVSFRVKTVMLTSLNALQVWFSTSKLPFVTIHKPR